MTKFLHFFQLILLFFSIFILLFSILILFFSKQLEHQFSQLKQEILNSDRSMETLFSLIQELTNAAEKYFALKRLFWKVLSTLFNIFNYPCLRGCHQMLILSICQINTDQSVGPPGGHCSLTCQNNCNKCGWYNQEKKKHPVHVVSFYV